MSPGYFVAIVTLLAVILLMMFYGFTFSQIVGFTFLFIVITTIPWREVALTLLKNYSWTADQKKYFHIKNGK